MHHLVPDVQNEAGKVCPLLNHRLQRTKKLRLLLAGQDVELIGTKQEKGISQLIAEQPCLQA